MATESFTYSNGALATVSGGTWANLFASATVNANQVVQGTTGGGSDNVAYHTGSSTGSNDNWAQATIGSFTGLSTSAGDFLMMSVACRVNSASGGSMVFAGRTTNGTIECYEIVNGTFSGQLGTSALAATAAAGVLKIEAIGTGSGNVKVYWDGTLVITATTTVVNGQLGGIHTYWQGANAGTTATLDDWSNAATTPAPVPNVIPPRAPAADRRRGQVPVARIYRQTDVFVASPQTWTGNDGTVTVTATSGAFYVSTWDGTAATITVTAAPGSFGATFPVPTSLDGTNRKILDQTGNVLIMRTFQSWSMPANLSNANITTALQDVAAIGFNAVTIMLASPYHLDASWHQYTNNAGQSYWTGTPWASTLGAAWASEDWVASECLRLGLILNMSFYGGNGSSAARGDWNAVTNTQMQTTGAAIATRYPVSSYPNIVWHLGWDDPNDATAVSRINALFAGINSVEGSTARIRWNEPLNGASTYSQDVSIGNCPNFYVTGQWMNCWYSWSTASVDIIDAGYNETGATNVPVGDCEPPYNGNTGTNDQQLRERMYSDLIRGGAYAAFSDEGWWPFSANGFFSRGGGEWATRIALAGNTQQAYVAPIANTYIADLTWAPTSFIVTGTGTGETRAAGGNSNTAALAYFPDSRTVAVNTSLIAGTGNVRIRWFDPTLNTYTTVAGSEAQSSSRSVTYPTVSRGDGSTDMLLVVDQLLDQTWTGNGATVTITGTSGSFTPGGTATWTGNGATVTVTATSGSFAASGTAVWSSTDGLVTVTGTSGSFAGTGTAVWTGNGATVTITATSDAFAVGAATWTGNGATVTITATSDAFVPGAVTWTGNDGTVAIAGTSGVFTPGAVTWAGNDGLVTVTAASGSFGLGAGPQTWNGTAGTVAIAATSDAFVASGTIVWTGNDGTVTVTATSGAFSSGAVTWTGNAGTLAIAATSGAFTVAGTAAWVGAAATLFVAALSGTFSGGAQFPFIRTGPLTLTKLDTDRTLTKLGTDRTLEALE